MLNHNLTSFPRICILPKGRNDPQKTRDVDFPTQLRLVDFKWLKWSKQYWRIIDMFRYRFSWEIPYVAWDCNQYKRDFLWSNLSQICRLCHNVPLFSLNSMGCCRDPEELYNVKPYISRVYAHTFSSLRSHVSMVHGGVLFWTHIISLTLLDRRYIELVAKWVTKL